MLLRLCAAVPPQHALLSGEGIQQVQGGTGESEDALAERQQSLETSGCVSALQRSCERIRDYYFLRKKVALSSIISILFHRPTPVRVL